MTCLLPRRHRLDVDVHSSQGDRGYARDRVVCSHAKLHPHYVHQELARHPEADQRMSVDREERRLNTGSYLVAPQEKEALHGRVVYGLDC